MKGRTSSVWSCSTAMRVTARGSISGRATSEQRPMTTSTSAGRRLARKRPMRAAKSATPRRYARPGAPVLAPRGPSRSAAMSALVLVVDDNEDNRCIIRDILRPRGFEVQLARDGASALRSIEERRPDVVLLDVNDARD